MFIDEWFEKEFYKQLPLGYHTQSNFTFGQFFWTHAYYPHENLELWRPVPDPNEPTKTIASNFRIVGAGKDAFRRTLPLHAPKLETNEEFLVIRAKRRPVLLVQPEPPLVAVNKWGLPGENPTSALSRSTTLWIGRYEDEDAGILPDVRG